MRPGTLRTLTACLAGLLLLAAAPAHAQTVQLAPFGGQAYGFPSYVTGEPGSPNRVYVVEIDGQIRLVEDGATQPTAFLDISADVQDGGESGMFSMAFPPDHASSGLFYVFYTRDDPTPGNFHFLVIEEFRRSVVNPEIADPASRRIVMEIPHFTAGNHNGGQLQFGPDNLLYISVGDGGNTPHESQNLGSLLGKLLRIDPRGSAPFQYSIPADNPFADGAGPNADEIYSYGLRNPYRFSFDRATGDLIIGDVGGGQREELDFKNEGNGRGANFGWPCFEGTQTHLTNGSCATPPTNHSPPVFDYRTGNGLGGNAAVNAGYVIRDTALPDHIGRFEYTDTYFDLPGVRTIQLSEAGSSGDVSLGVDPADQVFSSGQDACGHIYIAHFGNGGVVERLEPTTGPFPCKMAPVMNVAAPDYQAIRAAGGIPVSVSCDEDCMATATGTVTFTETFRSKKKSKKKKKKTTTKRRQVTFAPAGSTGRMQLNGDTLLLPLGEDQLSRLGNAVGTVLVSVSVTASGAGGGSASDAAESQSQAPKKKKKKRKKKKRKR